MLAEMGSRELEAWRAYDRVVGLPDSWTQTGMICATLVNMFSTGGKRYVPDDFAPRAKTSSDVPQSPEAGKMAFAMIAQAFNARPKNS